MTPHGSGTLSSKRLNWRFFVSEGELDMEDSAGKQQMRLHAFREPTTAELSELHQFVQSLETGFNKHDAILFNRNFADDIIWGNPNGGALSGWAELHSIHRGFFQGPMADARSRYTLHNAKILEPGIAVIHVKREAVSPAGEVLKPKVAGEAHVFHELAMYVLKRDSERWWLCAGQNTRVQESPAS
jgi:uncharacterized protein (TIGR02246 family)